MKLGKVENEDLAKLEKVCRNVTEALEKGSEDQQIKEIINSMIKDYKDLMASIKKAQNEETFLILNVLMQKALFRCKELTVSLLLLIFLNRLMKYVIYAAKTKICQFS